MPICAFQGMPGRDGYDGINGTDGLIGDDGKRVTTVAILLSTIVAICSYTTDSGAVVTAIHLYIL